MHADPQVRGGRNGPSRCAGRVPCQRGKLVEKLFSVEVWTLPPLVVSPKQCLGAFGGVHVLATDGAFQLHMHNKRYAPADRDPRACHTA